MNIAVLALGYIFGLELVLEWFDIHLCMGSAIKNGLNFEFFLNVFKHTGGGHRRSTHTLVHFCVGTCLGTLSQNCSGTCRQFCLGTFLGTCLGTWRQSCLGTDWHFCLGTCLHSCLGTDL